MVDNLMPIKSRKQDPSAQGTTPTKSDQTLVELEINMLGKLKLNSRGLSLLEVLISMLILAFGILGLAPMMVLSVDANSTSRDFSIAAELAKESLENYESNPAAMVAPYSNTENNVRDNFSRTTYIIDHTADTLIPDSRYKLVVVISWIDHNGLSQSTQMSTLVKKAT